MGNGNDLSQCKGALKATMDRCEFTDKTLALSGTISFFTELFHAGFLVESRSYKAKGLPYDPF